MVSLDEIKVFNMTLTAEQIYQIYLNNTDIILHDETTLGENWTVCVTPNNGTVNGTASCATRIEIVNDVPVVSSVTLAADTVQKLHQ